MSKDLSSTKPLELKLAIDLNSTRPLSAYRRSRPVADNCKATAEDLNPTDIFAELAARVNVDDPRNPVVSLAATVFRAAAFPVVLCIGLMSPRDPLTSAFSETID